MVAAARIAAEMEENMEEMYEELDMGMSMEEMLEYEYNLLRKRYGY